MTISSESILIWSVDAAFILLIVAMALAFVRLIRGPSLPDRVMALDLLTVITVGFCALHAIAADEPVYLDVAIALALVAFLATVAFARYAERRNARETDQAGDGGPDS